MMKQRLTVHITQIKNIEACIYNYLYTKNLKEMHFPPSVRSRGLNSHMLLHEPLNFSWRIL